MDEDTKSLLIQIKLSQDFQSKKMQELDDELKSIKKDFKEAYVTKLEFDPIKKLVYGAVGVILLAVLSALTALVVRS